MSLTPQLQILGWFHLGCESAPTGRAICTDQWQMWSLFSSIHKWMVWKGMKAEIVTSYHLTPWLVPSWDVCLPSALQGTTKVNPPVGQKNANGKGGDMSFLESLCTIRGCSLFWDEGGKCCFCGINEKAFEMHSFHSSSDHLCQFCRLVITNKSCPPVCIKFVDLLAF